MLCSVYSYLVCVLFIMTNILLYFQSICFAFFILICVLFSLHCVLFHIHSLAYLSVSLTCAFVLFKLVFSVYIEFCSVYIYLCFVLFTLTCVLFCSVSFSRNISTCLAFSTSSRRVSFSSSHWWSSINESPRGRQPCNTVTCCLNPMPRKLCELLEVH